MSTNDLLLLAGLGVRTVAEAAEGSLDTRADDRWELDRIAARHPQLQIVLAHVGWPWHLEAVAMALHKSNVYLDISGWKVVAIATASSPWGSTKKVKALM